MKTLDPVLKSELEKTEYIYSNLLYMNVDGTELYYTPWTTSILFNSILYKPRGMKVNNISYSSTRIVDDINIVIDDVDRSLLETFGETDAGVFPIKVTLVVLNSIGKVLANLVVFNGYIDRWTYKPGSISITAVSIFSGWTRVTTSKFSGSCRWKEFKNSQCQYAGLATKCDRTYSQCVEYGNEINFGGFPFLPSMINKKLKV